MGGPDPRLPPEELHEVFGTARGGEPTVERVYEPVASASAGIWRVRRDGRSAILKVVAHAEGGHENWRSGEEPTHWYYWRREVLAYETGLLEALPGNLRAPTCFLVAPRADGSVALWLEDLRGTPATDWELDRYGIAARHLGQTQGAYLGSRRLPVAAWLSRNWLRDYLSQRDGDLHLVADATAWDHPLVKQWFPDPPIARLQEMRRAQPQLLDALDRLPRTLCHLDLHPRNLFADGVHTTVAIDWAFAGTGAIGEDAGNLVPDSVLDFHLDPAHLDDLAALVAGEYHAGLRDAGWDGTLATVRLAMAATVAAKFAWIAPAILRVAAEGRETLNGRPMDEAMRWWAPTVTFLLDRADEARDLIQS